nr:DUF2089 domain-containing protein [Microlunatus panaciterrae]
MAPDHHAPSECPVCGDHLAVTRLGCGSCGTEVGGIFASCEFCALDAKDLDTLRVFLASRGNMRELERHLGVSYPTARLRFAQLLERLGLSGEPDQPAGMTREQILSEVAAGALTPVEATRLLQQLS